MNLVAILPSIAGMFLLFILMLGGLSLSRSLTMRLVTSLHMFNSSITSSRLLAKRHMSSTNVMLDSLSLVSSGFMYSIHSSGDSPHPCLTPDRKFMCLGALPIGVFSCSYVNGCYCDVGFYWCDEECQGYDDYGGLWVLYWFVGVLRGVVMPVNYYR